MKKIVLFLSLIIMVLMVSPALAQTADDVLADANNEAVLVISTGFVDLLKLVGGVVSALLVIYAVALYRSSPPMVQNLIIKNGQDVLDAFKKYAETTSTMIDDKLANVASTVFNAVMTVLDSDDTADDKPTPPADDNPVQ